MHSLPRRLSSGALTVSILALCAIPSARAQAPSRLRIVAPTPGACQVLVSVADARPGDRVGVAVEFTEGREQTVLADTRELAFTLSEPLRDGYRVQAHLNGVVVDTARTPSRSRSDAVATGPCSVPRLKDSDPLSASFYIGEAIDTFAPDDVGGYADAGSGTHQKLMTVAGIDFDYRLIGTDASTVRVYLTGETIHGVRTANVDCHDSHYASLRQCSGSSNPGRDFRAVIENASSLEVFFSPRVEFQTVQAGSASPAAVYATTHVGFSALANVPKTFGSYYAGLGLLMKGGSFEGSFLETGIGKNDLVSTRSDRVAVDGLLSFRIPFVGRGFVETTIDTGYQQRSSAVRTFFGVDFSLARLGW